MNLERSGQISCVLRHADMARPLQLQVQLRTSWGGGGGDHADVTPSSDALKWYNISSGPDRHLKYRVSHPIMQRGFSDYF